MIKPILIYPRRELRTPSIFPESDQNAFDVLTQHKDEIMAIVKDLYDTLEVIPNGVGLASHQIGSPDTPIAVLDPAKHADYKEPRTKFYAVAPVLLEKSEPVKLKEGCLSMPNYFEVIERFNKVKVKYFTIESDQPIIEEASGVMAQIWQHEIDHLNGIVFVEHLSKMRQDMAIKKMTKVRKRIEDFQWTPEEHKFFGAKGR